MILQDIKKNNPYIFNSWRGILYTEKGKKAGISGEWKDFLTFFNDVSPTYRKGLVLRRLYKDRPFSKDNFIWVTKEEAPLLKDNLIKLTYKGETLYLSELADKYNQSLAGVRIRYFRHKNNYSVEEIIFGKLKSGKRPTIDITELSTDQLRRNKASKMLSAYKIKDKKKGLECNLTVEDMLDIINHSCVYCGDASKIGCDRIDNSKGHTKDNVVPCCVECNKAKSDYFSFEEMKKLGETIKKIKAERTSK